MTFVQVVKHRTAVREGMSGIRAHLPGALNDEWKLSRITRQLTSAGAREISCERNVGTCLCQFDLN